MTTLNDPLPYLTYNTEATIPAPILDPNSIYVIQTICPGIGISITKLRLS